MPAANNRKGHAEDAIQRERSDGDDRGFEAADDLIRSDEAAVTEMEKFFAAPTNLPYVEPRPGYVLRWIRTAIGGNDDPANLAKAQRKGWRPVRLDAVGPDLAPLAAKHGDLAGAITVHGLVLCERLAEVDAVEKSFLRRKTDTQTRSITGELETLEHKDMPVSVHMKDRIQRGGRKPRVLAPDAEATET